MRQLEKARQRACSKAALPAMRYRPLFRLTIVSSMLERLQYAGWRDHARAALIGSARLYELSARADSIAINLSLAERCTHTHAI